MDLEQRYRTYAKYKWECLRRNPDYQKDFDELAKPPDYFEEESNCDWFMWRRPGKDPDIKIIVAFQRKWKLPHPVNYKYSIDEISLDATRERMYSWAKGHDYSIDSDLVVKILNEYDDLRLLDFDAARDQVFDDYIEEYKKNKKLVLEIDLEYDKETILATIKYWLELIGQLKEFIAPEKPPTRERHSFDKYDDYLKVWDMRQKGLQFPEIAREVFPEDFIDPSKLEEGDPHPNPESALAKVHQYYKEADRMIKSGI